MDLQFPKRKGRIFESAQLGVYACLRKKFASPAAATALAATAVMCYWANVSGSVTSIGSGLPCDQEIKVAVFTLFLTNQLAPCMLESGHSNCTNDVKETIVRQGLNQTSQLPAVPDWPAALTWCKISIPIGSRPPQTRSLTSTSIYFRENLPSHKLIINMEWINHAVVVLKVGDTLCNCYTLLSQMLQYV